MLSMHGHAATADITYCRRPSTQLLTAQITGNPGTSSRTSVLSEQSGWALVAKTVTPTVHSLPASVLETRLRCERP